MRSSAVLASSTTPPSVKNDPEEVAYEYLDRAHQNRAMITDEFHSRFAEIDELHRKRQAEFEGGRL
jgi:hypothetical protein